MRVYVYKEYNDHNVYGEELIEVYEKQSDAVARLKKSVSDTLEMSFDDAKKEFCDEPDCVTDEYVSIDQGKGILFWIVEAHNVRKSAR